MATPAAIPTPVVLAAFDGSPPDLPGRYAANDWLAEATALLVSAPNRWQQASATLALPPGTTYPLVGIVASEDVHDDGEGAEFAGPMPTTCRWCCCLRHEVCSRRRPTLPDSASHGVRRAVPAAAPLGLPLGTGAQQASRTFLIGWLGAFRRDAAVAAPLYEAFEAGLREHGWHPGVNVLIDYRASDANPQGLDEHAAELVRAKVDVMVVLTNPHVEAARRSTSAIPIVMVAGTDPVGFGLIASYARPGGNVPG